MDIFKLSRTWFDWCFENPEKISPNHTALYFFAIEHCNRLGWKKKFGFPTEMAKEALGVRSYNTYINTLNDLVEWGFIEMIEKSKNQYSANIIALSNYDKALDKALDKAMIKHKGKQLKSIDSIDIHNTNIPKTNIPIIYISEFSKEFQELYESWLKDRKTRKKPVTEKAMELQLKRCREWGEQKSVSIIQKAIEKGWTGLEDYDSKDIPKPKGVDYEAEKKKTLEREKAANEAKRQEQAEKDLKRREDDKILRWLDSLPESRKEQIEKEIIENHMVTRLRMPPEDAPESEKESQMNIINSAKKMVRITLARKYYFQDNQ